MNTKKLSLITALILLAIAPVQAQTTGSDLFAPNDLSLDLFGFTASRDKGGADKQAWGPGVGINYFFSQNWGLGADSYADAFELPYLLNISGLFRYPLGDSRFAPYAFAGFGRQWDHAAQWLGHLGAGLEFRFDQKIGIFADIRGVFAGETKDYAVFRFGFRLKFL